MQFFLFRHADKERSPTANPPLSQRGLKQANALAELIKKGELPRPTLLHSSTKTRATQTLQPLAHFLQQPIHGSDDLLERQASESTEDFLTRVKRVISQAEKKSQKQTRKDGTVEFYVTHYDWVEEFLSIVPSNTDLNSGQYHAWSPCQFMHFEIKDGLWHLNTFRSISS